MEALNGGNLPIGSALFSLRNSDGILVSEAGISAVEPIRSGSIFVDQAGNSTGLALANPMLSDIQIRFTLRNAAGDAIGQETLGLGARQHFANFVGELFPMTPPNFLGSLTFDVLTPNGEVAAVSIRQGVSAQGDPLFATLPVASLEQNVAPSGAGATELVLPHLGAGGIPGSTTSLSSQILLFNLVGAEVRGQIRLVGGNGLPLVADLDGISGSTFDYVIPPDGVLRSTLTSAGPIVQGYAIVSRTQGPLLPAATAVFRFETPEGLISEAGVSAIRATTRARVLVDFVGTQTGVAVARAGLPAGEVIFELFDQNGFSLATETEDLAAGGYLPIFVSELFPGEIHASFTGILEIRSSSPLVPITLKLTLNEREDPILTTLPIADLTLPLFSNTRILPQIGFGSGLSTRLIFLWPETLSGGQFRLTFTNSDSSPMVLPITGTENSQFDFSFNRGGARQVRPNNRSTPVQLLLNFGMPGQAEIPVIQGDTSVVRTLIVDSDGAFRDDFDPSFASLDPSVATIDAFGEIQGIQAGFSSLTVSLASIVNSATIQVTDVTSGPPGITAEGVVEDSSGLLFLTSPSTHRVLTLESLDQQPEEYAGVDSVPGHLDSQRATALFDTPTFPSLDRAANLLYVSDSANRRIRRVDPGADGEVSTLAGTGASGNQDGVAVQATFSDPQGVALDNRGGLWIVDRGNHTIRRLDLLTGIVSTVAGSPGSPGFQDGDGAAARFSMPTGIAFESESIAQQLQRQQDATPPPPTTVIVADTGNGALRRVGLDGSVETLTFPAAAVPQGFDFSPFFEPTGVGIDAFGTIYVSAILPNTSIVQIHAPKLLVNPRGISITQAGKLVIADGDSTVRAIRFGAPQIATISPTTLDRQGGQEVEIRGQNFSSEAVVVVGGRGARNLEIVDSTRIFINTPPLSGDDLRVTVQTRGGTAQSPFTIAVPPREDLAPGTIVTVAGGGSFAGDGGPASQALTNRPVGMTFDQHGNLFLAEALHNRIRRIDAQTGIIRTVAGQGVPTPFLDNVPALEATLNLPTHTAVTPEGDLLIADSGNHRIRKLDSSSGALFTIAGTGIGPGISGDGGPATQAQLSTPFGVAVDSTGAVYIADTGNNLVRRIDPVTQIIETVTGLQGPTGVDKGRNTLSIPISVSVDSNDRVLIADRGNHRIVRFSDLGFEVIAGTGISGFSGDGGLPLQASFASPSAVLADFDGNIHILDTANNRLRVIDSKTGLVSTVAGGTCCNLEDGIDPRQANLFSPFGLAADGAGNILISDFQNNLVRRIDAKTGLIGSVLGRGSNGDGSSALGAVMFLPSDVNFDPITLNLIIADREGFRVRELDAKGLIHTLAGNGKTFTFDGAGGTVIGDGLPAVDAAVAPTGIVKTDSGFLLIADSASGRIRGVDREGIINSVLVGLTGFVSMDIDSFENLIVSVSGFNVIVGLTPQGMVLPLAGDSNGGKPRFQRRRWPSWASSPQSGRRRWHRHRSRR